MLWCFIESRNDNQWLLKRPHLQTICELFYEIEKKFSPTLTVRVKIVIVVPLTYFRINFTKFELARSGRLLAYRSITLRSRMWRLDTVLCCFIESVIYDHWLLKRAHL